MAAKGFYVAQEGHVINALPPVDINGGKNSDVWSMKEYAHATILINMGVTGAASTVTLEECDDIVPTTKTAIAFNVFKEETDAGDTLGALVAAAAAGFASSANNNIMYVIEIDASTLAEDYPYLRVVFSDPAAATFAAVMVVLSGGRYHRDQSPTQLT